MPRCRRRDLIAQTGAEVELMTPDRSCPGSHGHEPGALPAQPAKTRCHLHRDLAGWLRSRARTINCWPTSAATTAACKSSGWSTRWWSTTARGRWTICTLNSNRGSSQPGRGGLRRAADRAGRGRATSGSGGFQLFRIGDAVSRVDAHAAISGALRFVKDIVRRPEGRVPIRSGSAVWAGGSPSPSCSGPSASWHDRRLLGSGSKANDTSSASSDDAGRKREVQASSRVRAVAGGAGAGTTAVGQNAAHVVLHSHLRHRYGPGSTCKVCEAPIGRNEGDGRRSGGILIVRRRDGCLGTMPRAQARLLVQSAAARWRRWSSSSPPRRAGTHRAPWQHKGHGRHRPGGRR